MKMKTKRRMRTRPRKFTLSASLRVAPYEVDVGGMKFPMDTRRVSFCFFMQDATHKDCMRKLQEVHAAMNAGAT